jgi:hypothetical protein
MRLSRRPDRTGRVWIASISTRTDYSLKTTSKLALTRRLIEEHRETLLSGLAPVSITLCGLATMLSSAVLRHRRTGRYFGFNRA